MISDIFFKEQHLQNYSLKRFWRLVTQSPVHIINQYYNLFVLFSFSFFSLFYHLYIIVVVYSFTHLIIYLFIQSYIYLS